MPIVKPWTWECVNNRRRTTQRGEGATRHSVIVAAEKAHEKNGYKDTVTTITSPRGIRFNYRPHARVSGLMVWERELG